MGVATLPNHPVRAAARSGVRRALTTGPGRWSAKRGVGALVGTATGRRAARWMARRYARRTVGGVRWRSLLYVPAAVTFARQRRRLGPPPAPVTLAAAYATPAMVAHALPRGRLRTCLTWLAHMWAYKIAFEVPYDHPDRARRRLQIRRPIAVDRAIGLGTPLSQRLQRRLRKPPRLTTLDRVLTAVYLLWEVEPHLALGWLLSRHPGRFLGAALRMALTFDATLLGYFAFPDRSAVVGERVRGRDGRRRAQGDRRGHAGTPG